MRALTLTATLGVLLCTVLLGLAVAHVYWALGGPSGRMAAVPSVNGRPLFNPSPEGTLLVAVALLAATAVVAGALGWIQTPVGARACRVLTFGLSFIFIVRAVGDFRYVGFFKSVGNGPFYQWDSTIYSPLCLAIGVAAFLVARSTR